MDALWQRLQWLWREHPEEVIGGFAFLLLGLFVTGLPACWGETLGSNPQKALRRSIRWT